MAASKTLRLIFSLCLMLCVVVGTVSAKGYPKFGLLLKGRKKSSIPHGVLFDVTKYGAVADGKTDNAKAFMDAWNAACSYTGGARANFFVPVGTYVVGEVTFSGPCKSKVSPRVVIRGVLKAPPSVDAFSSSAWITFRTLRGLIVTGGGTLDGQGAVEAWSRTTCPKDRKCKLMPTSLKVISCTNGGIYGIKLVDSKAFHVRINKCTNMQLHGLTITAPEDSPNTDGIHVSGSTGVVITKSLIGVGDDCVSLGDGNTNITVREVHCGPGHGISVGSLGKYDDEKPVHGVHVTDCTLTGTTNGVRIKTWPGSPALTATNMTFENIIMNRVSFPIIIDQNYCPMHHCTDKPSNVKISDITYRNITGTSFTRLAVDLICSSALPCQNIQMKDINLRYQDTNQGTASMCQNAKTTASGIMNPSACD